jgi:hypothetical protein
MVSLEVQNDLFVEFSLGKPIHGFLDFLLLFGQIEIHATSLLEGISSSDRGVILKKTNRLPAVSLRTQEGWRMG